MSIFGDHDAGTNGHGEARSFSLKFLDSVARRLERDQWVSKREMRMTVEQCGAMLGAIVRVHAGLVADQYEARKLLDHDRVGRLQVLIDRMVAMIPADWPKGETIDDPKIITPDQARRERG